MPAVTVARSKFQRLTLKKESSIGTEDGAATARHIWIQDPSFSVAQEAEEDTAQTTARGTQLAPWPGAKSCTLAFKSPLHRATVDTVGELFESALGGKESLTALSGVSSITATGFSFSGGTPSRWVAVTYASGRVVFRPVVRVSGSNAFFAFQLPTATGVSGVVNAADFGSGGACYFEDPSGDYLSFRAELDRAGEPGGIDYLLTGLVPGTLRIAVEGKQRVAVEAAFQGLDWTAGATLTNIGNPARPFSQASPWAGELFLLSDYDSPGAAPSALGLISASVNLAPTWEANEGTQSRLGATEGTPPSHPVREWVRQMGLADGVIELVLQVPQSSLASAVPGPDGTKFHLALIGYLGAPGSTGYSGDAHCHYAPLAYLASPPEEVIVGGRVAQKVRLWLRDERTLGNSAGQQSTSHACKWASAFFRA